ncbi:thioesterase-like superfamily-domain-containing protein [Aspergillus aurantiobrunneus]
MPFQPVSSFLEATSSLSLEKGSQGRFIARISRDWCTQHSVLGGYLTVLILCAAHQHINTEIQAKYPDPIHVFTQFLHMVPPGRVSISCQTVRATSRLCVVKLELELHQEPRNGHQQDGSSPPHSDTSRSGSPQQPPACIAIATFANLHKEKGLTQNTAGSTTTTPPLPNRQTECLPIDDPVVDATPVTRKLHWVAPRSADGLWGHRLGGHQREVWLSFRDGSRISDLLHLALLADMPLQPPATHTAGFYSRHALSTLCLSVEFKTRPDPNTEWVLIRSNSVRVVGGRYDMNVQIFDERGNVLALSNHVVCISDLRGKSRI